VKRPLGLRCISVAVTFSSALACNAALNGLADNDAGPGDASVATGSGSSGLGASTSSGSSTGGASSSSGSSSGASSSSGSSSGSASSSGAGSGASGSSSGGALNDAGSGGSGGSGGSSGGGSSGSTDVDAADANTSAVDSAGDAVREATPGPDATSDAASTDDGSAAPDSATIGEASAADAAPLSFAADVYPIITERCIACHTPGGTGFLVGHLDMTTNLAAGALAQLLMPAMGTAAGTAGTTCAASALTRVVPGSAATSLLFDKVNSKLLGIPALCGNPMPNPPSAPPLTSAQVSTIGAWIDQGANP